jgi:cellulose synthase/poly-beta-1,6-N-acetylglucosamine synthase-like glycosyltransferase
MIEVFVWTVLAAGALLLGVPVLYQTVIGLAAIPAHLRPKRLPPGAQHTRFAILVPAHNEQGLIVDVVKSLLDAEYPAPRRRVFVVADNCTDDTAASARRAGAEALERHDLTKRGKPYAINWALERIPLQQFDALAIVDADTLVDTGFLAAMDRHIEAGERAIQGYYGILNPDENWLTRLGALPASVKFRIHFPGKRLLGLSCPLAGNGMCFSMDLIRRFGWRAFSLTENWEYYAMLTVADQIVMPAPEAVIYSQVARSLKLGQTQRIRWMQGQLETLANYWRALIRGAFKSRPFMKLDAIMELMRPSHSLSLAWSTIYFGVCVAAAWYMPHATWLVGIAAAMLAVQLLYFVIGLALERPPLRTWLALGMAPFYIAWKLAISVKGLLTMSERNWVKTTRN